MENNRVHLRGNVLEKLKDWLLGLARHTEDRFKESREMPTLVRVCPHDKWGSYYTARAYLNIELRRVEIEHEYSGNIGPPSIKTTFHEPPEPINKNHTSCNEYGFKTEVYQRMQSDAERMKLQAERFNQKATNLELQAVCLLTSNQK